MAGLVEEIQAQAIDPTVKLSDLLRRVKLAAAKLKLQETANWVDLEMGGYLDVQDKDIPAYRVANGQLMQRIANRGTIRAFGPPKLIAALSVMALREPISSLEELATANGSLAIPLDHEIASQLITAETGFGQSYHVTFGQNVPVSILSHVRDMVLDWACSLENQGILGEGISFSMEEKRKAEQAAQSITINNYGHMHQGDVNGHQNRTVVSSTDNSTNSLEISDTFDQLIQAVDSSIGNENDRETILELVRAMQAAQGTPEYKTLFQQWVGYLADYATVLGPFLPALSNLAG